MTLTIARLGHLGDGIAEGPVYVPRTLPGEVVEGAASAGRLDRPRIVTPSPDRVAPPCPHYSGCGGCQLQHASDRFVARWKAETVARALAAHDLPAPIRRVATSPAKSRRRATLAGRRTKTGAIVGFHGRASHTIVEVPDCRVLRPEIVALLPALADLTRLGASRKAELALAVTWSDAGADLAVSGGKPLDAALRRALSDFADAHRLARLAWAGETVVERAPPIQRIGRHRVVPPPGGFLQATAEGEAALQAAVAEALAGATRIADLFAGAGTFTLPLAEAAAVHAVEADGAMTLALDRAWRAAEGLKRVTVETRDLARRPLTAAELSPFDGAVLDPPRAGAEAQVAEIAASRLDRVAMVSCNPVTFARDAARLAAAGLRIAWIDVVDQFRWSPHIELAASLVRDHMPPGTERRSRR